MLKAWLDDDDDDDDMCVKTPKKQLYKKFIMNLKWNQFLNFYA